MKDYSVKPKIKFCDYTFDDEVVLLAEELSCQHNFRSNYHGELIIGLKGLSPSSFVGMITEWDADVVDANSGSSSVKENHVFFTKKDAINYIMNICKEAS